MKQSQDNHIAKIPRFNRGLRSFSKTSPQPNLFESSAPAVSLEPLPNHADRVRLVVRQLDCRWELIPSLSPGEAEVLLRALAGEKVGFGLDLNHGWPIEAKAIHWAAERVIDAGVRS